MTAPVTFPHAHGSAPGWTPARRGDAFSGSLWALSAHLCRKGELCPMTRHRGGREACTQRPTTGPRGLELASNSQILSPGLHDTWTLTRSVPPSWDPRGKSAEGIGACGWLSPPRPVPGSHLTDSPALHDAPGRGTRFPSGCSSYLSPELVVCWALPALWPRGPDTCPPLGHPLPVALRPSCP